MTVLRLIDGLSSGRFDDPITTQHPRSASGGVDRSVCELAFHVRRDASIVFLRVILPTVLIVYLGMMTVFLSAADHSGDRAALLGVSILICMLNLDHTRMATHTRHEKTPGFHG